MDRDDVLRHLRAWTAFADPAGGEPLPLAHALRHAGVHETLVAALALIEASAPRVRPRNAGRAWSHDDDERLGALFDAGTPTMRMAETLERTRGSVTARLVKLGRIEATPGMGLRY
jgi:hypothetical protein